MSQIFCIEIVSKEGKLRRSYFWLFVWGMAKLKTLPNERLIGFQQNKSVFPQFNTHNLKL